MILWDVFSWLMSEGLEDTKNKRQRVEPVPAFVEFVVPASSKVGSNLVFFFNIIH